MGTDIHLFVERRMGAGSPWMLVATSYPCRECRGTGQVEGLGRHGSRKYTCADCKGKGRIVGFGRRSYWLFAMLANVRSCDGVEPIAEPRGLPRDLSAKLAAIHRGKLPEGMTWSSIVETYEAVEVGQHSQSWLTVRELRQHEPRLTAEQRTAMGEFWDDFLPAIESLGAPEDIRIVFGFDS